MQYYTVSHVSALDPVSSVSASWNIGHASLVPLLFAQYPVGYHDALKEKELAKQKASESNGSDDEGKPMKGKTAKRKKSEVDSEENNNTKKRKLVTFKLAPDLQKLISNDSINSNLWNECKKQQPNGRAQFLNTVEERFLCICCQELVFKPVTTECKHNICLPCLQRSFKAEVYTCPACRFDLGKGYKMEVNETLRKCLVMLLPGYDAGR
ncbi:E3 ubiquitin-protein ligase uhrf1 [Halocaridina rubra]|uniref:E3 ubiquitin-protein ligase uhrf1 n=1 Tax=Halocaridina rubra TaxID=373956 RepID=A0AAN8WSE9_HALRR